MEKIKSLAQHIANWRRVYLARNEHDLATIADSLESLIAYTASLEDRISVLENTKQSYIEHR